MERKVVLSLYDYTGIAARPWAQAGYSCFCFDIQHDPDTENTEVFPSGGSITYRHSDLHDKEKVASLAEGIEGEIAFLMAFPVCTDLAVSGAAWFASKAEKDPLFQDKAAAYAIWCGDLGDKLGCPYFVENPVSRLATLWRKPDHLFHPFEYGGYIPKEDAIHPTWPEYIAPRDAYSKKTCFWTGGGFVMPPKKPVECNSYGNSTQHSKLGGKSIKTKNIRSATPRGVVRAVFLSNSSHK